MNAQLDDLQDAYSYARFRAKHENKTVYLYQFAASGWRYSVRDEAPFARGWTLIASVSPSGVVTPESATGGAALA